MNAALNSVYQGCFRLGRNNACYGNNNLKADLVQNAAVAFSSVGDQAPLSKIKSLKTMPLNSEDGTWGLAVLKAQVNLPDTFPGQSVIFLLYGDTSLSAESGDMKAFYFTSNLGVPACKEMPFSSIVIRSPEHMKISFKANGVDISIASTIRMYAETNKQMAVQLLEGHATVATAQGSVQLKPGEMTTVQLGGANGLEAVGAPSAPAKFPWDYKLVPVLCLLDRFFGVWCPAAVPPTATVVVPIPDSDDAPASDDGPDTSAAYSGGPAVQPGPAVVLPVLAGKPGKAPKATYVPKPPKATYVPKPPKATYPPKPTPVPKPPKK
jgi:hypothetical protein